MTIEISRLDPAALEVTILGKVERQDYGKLAEQADRAIEEHGGVNLLVRLKDLEGWTMPALWEDLKFGVGHYRDLKRMALVAEQDSFKRWLAPLAKPFTRAEVRFFGTDDLGSAREWVKHGEMSELGGAAS